MQRLFSLVVAGTLAMGTTAAMAQPRQVHQKHPQKHYAKHLQQPQAALGLFALFPQPQAVAPTVVHHPRTVRVVHRRAAAPVPAAESYASVGSVSNSLVADARRYLGTNPTGRRSLWCGAFMDKVLRETGHKGGGNLAKGYLHYGTRVSGPVVGALAIFSRSGGGHVGVVSGIDKEGHPIVISGNHGNTVAESVYKKRAIAYVLPN